MSLAGRLVLLRSGSRLVQPARLRGSQILRQTVVYSLSSSQRRLYAQHAPGHNHAHEGPASINEEVEPYKGGASAIDKAVHLFFFTEILRGKLALDPMPG